MEQEKLKKEYVLYILMFSVCAFFYGCNISSEEDELSQILGIEKVEIEENQMIEEWAGIQGDGFILISYSLSEKTIVDFMKNSLQKLPDKKDKDKEWHKYNWSTFPIDSSYSEVFITCLNYSSDNEKLKIQLSEIEKRMGCEGMYYAFYYRPSKENPQNVQLYILDIQNRKCYMIDQQI